MEQGKTYKLAVFSDTHGNYEGIQAHLSEINECDYFVFLGDGNRDVDRVIDKITAKVVRVRGNCDFYSDISSEVVLKVGESNFLITHGNLYGVKSSPLRISLRAGELSCDYVLYGHTHCAGSTSTSYATLINPGSGQRRGTFAMVEGDGKTFSARICLI